MYPTIEQQIAVLDRARQKILENPRYFEMDRFHSQCGTTHCIAGWIRINEDPGFEPVAYDSPQRVKQQNFRTRDFSRSLVPDFHEIFYVERQVALEWLENREYAKPRV